jgi:insulysin
MLDFYNKYIHPHSTVRTKAAVHLIAQSSPADLAANTSPAEKLEKLTDVITQMLQQLGLEEINADDLKKRMEKVDISSADAKSIASAVGSYLKETAGLAAEEVKQVVEQGQEALAQVLPSLGIVSKDAAEEPNGTAEVNGEVATNGETHSKTVIVEDVKAFKASIPLTAGVTPVKDLSEFEELGAKL